MADSFVRDSFIPDTPVKAEKPEALGPAGKYVDVFAEQPGLGGRLAALAQHVVNPKTAAEHVQSLGVMGPLMGLGRGAATALGLPGLVGPMAAAGTQAGAGAVTRGESPGAVVGKTALGAATAGGTELAITRLLGNPAATKMFEQAKAALPEALEAIKGRLHVHPLANEAIITVPSMGTVTVSEAVKRLGELRGTAYTATVDEVRHAMNAIDFSKNAVKAGDAFVARLVKDVKSGFPTLFDPLSKSKKALTSDTARDVADALTTQPSVAGLPAGIPAVGGLVGAAPAAGKFLINRLIP